MFLTLFSPILRFPYSNPACSPIIPLLASTYPHLPLIEAMEVKLPTLSEMCLRKAATQQTNATLSSLVPTSLLYKLSSKTDSVVRREYPSKVISDLQSPWICIGDRTLSDASTTLVDFETVATTSLSPPPSRPSSPPPVPSRFIVGGSLGTDLLQFYIDSANESGSLHDERFTKEFWDYLEKSFVLSTTSSASSDSSCPPNKKLKTTPTSPLPPPPTISFSLQNCTLLGENTFSTFASSNCGKYIHSLDLSGCFLLTSALFTRYVLPSVPNVRRLCLKNCRKLTDEGVNAIQSNLKSLVAIGESWKGRTSPDAFLLPPPTPFCHRFVSLRCSAQTWAVASM